MHAGLDDLVIALYVTIDDLLGPDPRRGHPGRKPRLSDAELVCLAVAQVLLGCHDEHRWLRVCYGRLGHLFPHLPNQPGYNKRLRAARWLLDQVGAHWPARPQRPGHPQAAGRHPGPLRGQPSDGQAVGAGWVGRLRLVSQPLALVLGPQAVCPHTPDGSPIAWCLASPKLGEREVATALLDRDSIHPGQVLIVDKGLTGAAVQDQVAGLGAVLVRPDRRDEPARFGSLRPVRQWIESVIDTLKGQLGLEQHGGRTPTGVHARVAQRLLALAAAVWFNWQLGAEHKRSLVAYDH